jgi:predicted nucleotidyltransferase
MLMEQVELAIQEFKKQIETLYGSRLKQVLLFGSWARNTATTHSDVDLTVVLEGSVQPGREIDRMADILLNIQLAHNLLITVYPVSAESFKTVQSPLLKNIHREGIPV